MKKKIITFFSILAVGTVSCGGLLVNACAYNTGNRSDFWCKAEGNNIGLYNNNGHAIVHAMNTPDYYNYKYVEVTTYECNGWCDFDELNFTCNSGNTRNVSTTTSATGADNMLAVGIIGNAQNAQAGSHYFAVTNSKKPETDYYLDNSYYNAYLTFDD